MTAKMMRRDVITLLGGAAATPLLLWPRAPRAQQSERIRHIGVLMNTAAESAEGRAGVAAFQQVMQQLGWTQGRNVQIETRWGANDVDLDSR